MDTNSQKTYGLQAVIRPSTAVSIVQHYMVGFEQTDNTDDGSRAGRRARRAVRSFAPNAWNVTKRRKDWR